MTSAVRCFGTVESLSREAEAPEFLTIFLFHIGENLISPCGEPILEQSKIPARVLMWVKCYCHFAGFVVIKAIDYIFIDRANQGISRSKGKKSRAPQQRHPQTLYELT